MDIKRYLPIVAVAVALAMSNCSKQNDIAPIKQVVGAETDVTVANGRLVFANQQAFDKAFNALDQLGKGPTAQHDLAVWESSYEFVSLRAASNKESDHLEDLEAKGQAAPAYNLLNSFGFPLFYAAIINQSGEYQIGDKIYWYNNGFRYQATSEAELATIKQNPMTAIVKSEAGSRTVGQTSIKNPSHMVNIQNQTNDPYSVTKYGIDFRYPFDYNSRRRILYGTRVFAEKGYEGGLARNFRTAIVLQLKLEYYSANTDKWYPAKETYFYRYNVDFTGNPSIQQYVYPTQNVHLERDFSTGDGLYEITMATDNNVQGSTLNNDPQPSDVIWTFGITGSIFSYAKASPGQSLQAGPGTIW